MKYNEDDVILCTVKNIVGTTVFLETEDGQQASMIFSEVSPGRIRNIREYVVPNKKVACKVLRIKGDHLEVSLRRVAAREREEIMERHKKEKVLSSILKPILKEKTPEILEKISEKYELADFLDEARENPSLIQKFVSKQEAETIEKMFAEKKEKDKEVTKKIKLTSASSSGLEDIKSALDIKETPITYLGSSKFLIKATGKDFKTCNNKIESALNEIKEKAKSKKIVFEMVK